MLKRIYHLFLPALAVLALAACRIELADNPPKRARMAGNRTSNTPFNPM